MFINFIILILLEFYFWGSLKSLLEGTILQKFTLIIFAIQFAIFAFSLYKLLTLNQQTFILRSAQSNIYLGVVMTILVSKFIFLISIFAQDIGRFFVAIYNFAHAKLNNTDAENFVPNRRAFLNQAALILGGIPLISMTYGILKGKYKYTVKKLTLGFSDLPQNFDGLKVVQISDIHSGSFDDIEAVKKGIDPLLDFHL